jgi:uncharacterized membrane protein YGL010W
MRTLQGWLDDYSEGHQNRFNQKIHRLCVPAIFLCVVGFFHFLPLRWGWVHVGDLLMILLTLWYLTLGLRAFALMIGQIAAAALILFVLQRYTSPLGPLTLLFGLAWLGQFWGHHLEGRRPSFFKDLQFLLIGPLWVFWGH